MATKKDNNRRGFIRIPQTKYRKEANTILALGVLLILAGLFIFVGNSERATRLFAFRPVLLLAAGTVMVFTALAFTGSSATLFSGLFCFCMGVVTLLTDSNILSYSFKQLWPTIMIGSGFSLAITGVHKAGKIRTVYAFPAIMLVSLGIVFLLFSLHVFPLTFRQFISHWWPLLIVASGVILVSVFFVQQVNAKSFPYMEDDSLVGGDEK